MCYIDKLWLDFDKDKGHQLILYSRGFVVGMVVIGIVNSVLVVSASVASVGVAIAVCAVFGVDGMEPVTP